MTSCFNQFLLQIILLYSIQYYSSSYHQSLIHPIIRYCSNRIQSPSKGSKDYTAQQYEHQTQNQFQFTLSCGTNPYNKYNNYHMIRLPEISQEERQYLAQRGYTPFTTKPLSSFYKPLSWQYQLTNLAILGITIPMRYYFKRRGFLYFPLTLVIVSVPFFNLIGMTRANDVVEGYGVRKSRQHLLQHIPKVTREAYQEVQRDLLQDIANRQRENSALKQRIGNRLL